jgi:hypothetical protein
VEAGVTLSAFVASSTAGIYTATVPAGYPGQALQLWVDGHRQRLAQSAVMVYNKTGVSHIVMIVSCLYCPVVILISNH